jgi:hypothetical protein
MRRKELNPLEPKLTHGLATFIVLVCIAGGIAAGLSGEYLLSLLLAAIGFATKLASR